MAARKLTRQIMVGPVPVGGGAPVAVQSMTNTDTRDPEATLKQIGLLAAAGCEIVRVAAPDMEAARALERIAAESPIPVVADIHFDHRLALEAVRRGVHGLRINPGNIGGRDKTARVAEAAGRAGIPIRVGVNAGSLPRDIRDLYGGPSPEAMVRAAQREAAILEEFGFRDIKIALKSSHVPDVVQACRQMSAASDYPLHLGVTEAGTLISGAVKSALGIGLLLAEGIGDTIRVSLTRPPVEEVRAAYEILRALDIRHRGPEIISCPTCGRCEIDLFSLVEKIESALTGVEEPIKVAVMGCAVNGPGEAAAADVGVAGGRGQGVLFRGGAVVRKAPESELAEALLNEIDHIINIERNH